MPVAQRAKIQNLNQVMASLMPSEDQLASATSDLVEKLKMRMFPHDVAGQTPEGKPYPGYRTYPYYLEPGRPVPDGGESEGRFFSQGWGGGADSVRASYGLPIGATKTLRFTGQTAESLTSLPLGPQMSVIYFSPAGAQLAELLQTIYKFWGVSEEEEKFMVTKIEAAIVENSFRP